MTTLIALIVILLSLAVLVLSRALRQLAAGHQSAMAQTHREFLEIRQRLRAMEHHEG